MIRKVWNVIRRGIVMKEMKKEMKKDLKVSSYTINMGPQHPAAHGVLRLILGLDGEKVNRCDSHIGLLHRGSEELMEGKSIEKGLPYMDRLDYVSMMSQEHGFILGVEKLKEVKVKEEVKYIRVIYLEITRLLNHLLAISCHALDVGAMTGYFFGFEERERLMELYERVSGGRFHAAYFRVGGIKNTPSLGTLMDIRNVVNDLKGSIVEIEGLLSENRIWKKRLKNVGVVDFENSLNRGFTGVMLRGSGVCWDLRKNVPYEVYNSLKFNVIVGKNGDSYDRYLIRVEEMKESIFLIEQCIDVLLKGDKLKIINEMESRKKHEKMDMARLIKHFKFIEKGTKLVDGFVYVGTESPKGEFGISINSKGERKEIKVRSSGLSHLSGLDYMCKGLYLADVVTVIGTQDIVFGEIDR